MKRTRLARKTPLRAKGPGLKRGGRLRGQSDKRAAEKDERVAVRQATFERDHYRCVAGYLTSFPCSLALECDEIHGRGRIPGSHLDLNETQTLCSLCHRLKTDYVQVATLLGLYGPDTREREADLICMSADVGGLRPDLANPFDEIVGRATLRAAVEWDRRKRQAAGFS